MPGPVQHASAAVWSDEAHVAAIREAYRAKFDVCDEVLAGRFGYARPAGGFFLWLDMSHLGGAEEAALTIWQSGGVRVIPGAYLAEADRAGSIPVDPTSALLWLKTRRRSGRRSSVWFWSLRKRLVVMASLSEQAPLLPGTISARFNAWLCGMLGYAVLAVCGACALSLLSWQIADPSLTRRRAAPSAISSGPSAPSSQI